MKNRFNKGLWNSICIGQAKLLFSFALFVIAASCENSPFGPQLNLPSVDVKAPSVASGEQPSTSTTTTAGASSQEMPTSAELALEIYDNDQDVQGRTNSATIRASVAICGPIQKVLINDSASAPQASDDGFQNCTTAAKGLSGKISIAKEGETTVYLWALVDGSVYGTPYSARITVDTTAPTGGLAISAIDNSNSSLSATITEPTVADYTTAQLYYLAGACPVTSATGTAVSISKSTGTITTTVSGLSASTQYCLRVYFSDDVGNVSSDDAVGQQADATTHGLTCSRTSGHNVYYGNSSVSQVLTCDKLITAASAASKPSFLTQSVGTTTTTYSGTATDAAASVSWDATLSGDSVQSIVSLSTTTLASSSLTGVFGTSLDVVGHYASDQTLDLSVTLANTWDGSMNDVMLTAIPGTATGADTPAAHNSLSIVSTDTDFHGLKYYESCPGSGSYVCPATSSSDSGLTETNHLTFNWRYSAFDQGTYTLKLRPMITIESGINRLTTSTITYTVPLQSTGGNVQVVASGTDTNGNLADQDCNLALDFNKSSSTAVLPAAAIIYGYNVSGTINFGLKSLTVDRTDDPATAPSAVTTSNQLAITNPSNTSNYYFVKSLSGGKWGVIGIQQDNANREIFAGRLTNASPPAYDTGFSTTSVHFDLDSQYDIASLAVTDPFTDGDGKERIGLAFVRIDGGSGSYYLSFAKINLTNPSATTANSIQDDTSYEVDSNSGANDTADVEGTYSCTSIDRVNIAYTTDSDGTPYFYSAYRCNTNIQITKLKANDSSSSYGVSSATLKAGALASSGYTDDESISLALGKSGSQTVVGVVYRQRDSANSGKPYCYFTTADQNLANPLTPLDISEGNYCYWPSIHYNATTGKFLVVYAAQISGTWKILFREIAPTATTLTGSALAVASLSSWPQKLATAFYASGNFMGLFYRINGLSEPRFHGFHVPGF